jgi:AcrR family transcriptional regulator
VPVPKTEPPIDSVWTRPTRIRDQPLSRERIVVEAMRLLDAEGIDALSMRRLGTRLNAGATSMYTHVANKTELIELVVDAAYGELDVPVAGDRAGWRAAAGRCARDLRGLLLRHPWMVSVLGETGLAYLGPNMMRLAEGMLAMLETAGFVGDEADRAMNTLVAYAIGRSASEAAWLKTLRRSGQGEREWVRRLMPSAEEAARAYPRLRQRYAAHRDRDPEQTREDNFTYGLERVLDGLETRLGRDS